MTLQTKFSSDGYIGHPWLYLRGCFCVCYFKYEWTPAATNKLFNYITMCTFEPAVLGLVSLMTSEMAWLIRKETSGIMICFYFVFLKVICASGCDEWPCWKLYCQGLTWTNAFFFHPDTPVNRNLSNWQKNLIIKVQKPNFCRRKNLLLKSTHSFVVTFLYRTYSIIQSILSCSFPQVHTCTHTAQKCQPNNISISVFASLICEETLGFAYYFLLFSFFIWQQ